VAEVTASRRDESVQPALAGDGVVTLSGVGASLGMGVGPAVLVGGEVPEPPDTPFTGDRQAELVRGEDALAVVAADLEDRGRRAGGDAQAVLEAQALTARDPGLAQEVFRHVNERKTAARAVYEAFGTYRALLALAGDYMAARVADLDDIRDRVVAHLLGVAVPGVPSLTTRSVLVARDLAPADTALLDPLLVAGFVTEEGGPTSHTAIIARAMNVPAVVACVGATSAIRDGVQLLVDGTAGLIQLEPDEATVAAAQATMTRRAAAMSRSSGPGATADGHRVPLLANVGGAAETAAALEAGAEGVGLFRTEFVFLDRTTPPSEDEQVGFYRAVLVGFSGRKVVARVLDAGADKPLAFLGIATEPNPALGVRGLRALLTAPDVLAAQLRALSAAAAQTGALLEVMAPMVADAADAQAFVEAGRAQGLQGPLGVMVEVPSAALRARSILKHADFLSLGTNDLTQYTFAADRQVGSLAAYQSPWHPALLDLVAAAASAGHAVGKPCGVCGEAASAPALACVLVGLGVTSLSMSAGALPMVRAALAAHTLDQCQQAAAAALAATSAAEARAAARATLPALSDLSA
jgi:phosphotransferase system enzyme I (PtsI)